MIKKLIVAIGIVFIYFLFTYQYLNSLLINVEQAENEVVVILERQQYLLESMTNISYEISKYNNEQIQIPLSYLNKTEEVEIIKESIVTSRKALLELNSRLDSLSTEVTGCSNRLAVSQKRLAESISEYEKCKNSVLFIPVSKIFGFKTVKFSIVKLNPICSVLYVRKD